MFDDDQELQDIESTYVVDTDFDESTGIGNHVPGEDFGSMIMNQTNLMKIEARGIIGIFERIPIIIKLSVTQLSMLGMVALAALLLAVEIQSLYTVNNTTTFNAEAVQIGKIITAFQNERNATNTIINLANVDPSNATTYLASLYPLYNATASADQVFRQTFAPYFAVPNYNLTTWSTTDRIITMLQAYNNSMLQLDSTRGTVQDAQASGPQVYAYYSTIISSLYEVLILFTNSANTPLTKSYVAMVGLLENQLLIKGQGEAMFIARSLNFNTDRSMTLAINARNSALKVALDGSSADIVALYQTSTDPAAITYMTALEGTLSPNRAITTSVSLPNSLTSWVNATGQVVAGTQIVVNYITDQINQGTITDKNTAVALIISICVVVVIFWAFCIATTVLMSVSIVGPWKRMNSTLKTAISKFVPSHLIALIGAINIADVTLGQHKEQNLAVLKIGVKNFASATVNMDSKAIFTLLESYLGHIGDVVRTNGGFILRYDANGFVALFKEPYSGFKAAIQSQNRMVKYNNTKGGVALFLTATVQASKCIIGTVGENQRMEGALIIQDSEVAKLLDQVSSNADIEILTTSKTIERCGSTKKIKHRKIGTLADGQVITEILNTEKTKATYKKDFEKAVKLFESRKIVDAQAAFKSITNEFPDMIASKYLNKCNQLMDHYRCRINVMPVSAHLRHPTLKQALEIHVKSEFSEENIDIWDQIETFKTLTDKKVLLERAREIYDGFVSNESKTTININQQARNFIADMLTKTPDDIDPRIFNGIQTDVEKVMEDTVARFVVKTECYNALAQEAPQIYFDQL